MKMFFKSIMYFTFMFLYLALLRSTMSDSSSDTSTERQNIPVDFTTDEQPKETANIKETAEANQSQKDLEIFRKLFLQKRGQHFEAVKSLMESYDYEKTYQMIDLLLTRMRTVVGTSRSTLITAGFEPGMPFPTDETTKDAIAVIIENAALFGDMALSLPDITHASLAKKKDIVPQTLKWSITFSQNTGFLDDMHTHLFHLASQELDIIPKEPDYVNPYRELNQHASKPTEKKKKEKPEKKRGPRVTKVEL